MSQRTSSRRQRTTEARTVQPSGASPAHLNDVAAPAPPASADASARTVADDDRREVLRALLDAQRRIGDVIAALAGGDP